MVTQYLVTAYDATQTITLPLHPDEVSGLCLNSLDVKRVSVLSYSSFNPHNIGCYMLLKSPSPLPSFTQFDPGDTDTVNGHQHLIMQYKQQLGLYSKMQVQKIMFTSLGGTVEIWDNVTPTFDAIDTVCEGSNLASPLINFNFIGRLCRCLDA